MPGQQHPPTIPPRTGNAPGGGTGSTGGSEVTLRRESRRGRDGSGCLVLGWWDQANLTVQAVDALGGGCLQRWVRVVPRDGATGDDPTVQWG